jgi:hypothetical protein
MLQGSKAHSTSNEGRTARRPQVLTDQFVGWNSRTFPATARAPQAVRPTRCCDERETRVAAYGSQAQTTKFIAVLGMSASDRRSVPKAAVSNRSMAAPYSITSSARSRNNSEIVRPSALAVVRLRTSSNFVGCSIGISPGFVPRRILSTNSAARRNRSGKFGP